jgi:hypothetical protein
MTNKRQTQIPFGNDKQGGVTNKAGMRNKAGSGNKSEAVRVAPNIIQKEARAR